MQTTSKEDFLVKGGTAYIAESLDIRKVTILSCSGGLYKIRFDEGGGICVKAHRLFATEEEAKQSKVRKSNSMQHRFDNF